MIRVLVVEDDRSFAQALSERLLSRGMIPRFCETVPLARQMITQERFDYVFIDLMLPPHHRDEGIAVLRYALQKQKEATLLLMTSRDNGTTSIVNEARDLGARYFFDKNDPGVLDQMMTNIDIFEIERTNQIFISHGHNDLLKYKLKDFVERRMQRRAVVLSEQPSGGLTIVEKLEKFSERCFFAIILMTRDDQQRAGGMRARQNVIHELGFFQGKYGRRNVVLLVEAGVELFSNISGIVCVEFQEEHFAAAFDDLRMEIEEADARRKVGEVPFNPSE